jgi:hypothetical protein
LVIFNPGYNVPTKTLICLSTMPKQEHPDSDLHKGAVEQETTTPAKGAEPYLQGQLGHRDEDEMIKEGDTDFPEPGSSPEHSGEAKR